MNKQLKPLTVEHNDLDELEDALEAIDELERRFRKSGEGLSAMRELLATVSRFRNKIN